MAEQTHQRAKRLREIEAEIAKLVLEMKYIGEQTTVDWQREVILWQVVPAVQEALSELGDML